MTMKDDDKYLDPKQNPMIKTSSDFEGTTDEEKNPLDFEERQRIPVDLKKKKPEIKEEGIEEELTPEDLKGLKEGAPDEGPDELERAVLKVIGDVKGAYDIIIEDGEAEPLFTVTRTAEGNLEVKTSEGEVKSFSELSNLERKLIRYEIKNKR